MCSFSSLGSEELQAVSRRVERQPPRHVPYVWVTSRLFSVAVLWEPEACNQMCARAGGCPLEGVGSAPAVTAGGPVVSTAGPTVREARGYKPRRTDTGDVIGFLPPDRQWVK